MSNICLCSLAGTSACKNCLNNPEYNNAIEISPEVYTVYRPKPTTNADFIRAMTDEKLAEWIESIASCRLCLVAGDCKGETAISKFSCKQRWLDWLSKPVCQSLEYRETEEK